MKFINNRPLTFFALVGVLIAILFFTVPYYRVWSQEMAGKAELARANYNRRIKITEADAEKESAFLLATADSARAVGRANANKVLASSLQGGKAYLDYLWLESLAKKNDNLIYIPTENNFPIMEAGRFNKLSNIPTNEK